MANLPVEFPADDHANDAAPESNEHLLLHSLSLANDDDSEQELIDQLDHEEVIQHILSDPHVTQHMTRTFCDGIDSIVGYFRCKFAPEQQRSILHVPLHPPLPRVPAVEALVAEQSDVNLEARIRVTDRQKFGLRLEVILPAPCQVETTVLVELIVTSENPDTSNKI